jgi:hypothetical protein
MAKELSRVGAVGLELTREEVIEIEHLVNAVERKAQCREVNGDVLEKLMEVSNMLDSIDNMITDILDD